jgi:hypothetical protein
MLRRNSQENLLRAVLEEKGFVLSDKDLARLYTAYRGMYQFFELKVKKRELQPLDKMIFFSFFVAFILKLEKVDKNYLLEMFDERAISEMEEFFR